MPHFPLVCFDTTASSIMHATRFTRLTGLTAACVGPNWTKGGLLTSQIMGSDDNATGTNRWGLYKEYNENVRAIDPLAVVSGINGGVNCKWYTPTTGYAALAQVYGDTGAGSITWYHRYRLISVVKDENALCTSATFINVDNDTELTLTADLWFDGSYSFDLLAALGVTIHDGREDNDQFDEVTGGQNLLVGDGSPFTAGAKTRNARGEIYKFKQYMPENDAGTADLFTQSHNFRPTVTNNAAKRISFADAECAPPRFDGSPFRPDDFLDDIHYINASGWTTVTAAGLAYANKELGDPVDGVFETNGGDVNGPVSWLYQSASWEDRRRYKHELAYHWLGYWHTIATDLRVTSSALRAEAASFGLCNDEPTGTVIDGDGNVVDPYFLVPGMPELLYERGDRRPVLRKVRTFRDLWGGDPATLDEADRVQPYTTFPSQTICVWGYGFDLHGGVDGITPTGQYVIGSYNEPYNGEPTIFGVDLDECRPHAGQCRNVLTYGTSATRLAWGPSRLEPNYSSCGDATGAVNAYCALNDLKPGDITYEEVISTLQAIGAPMSWADVQALPESPPFP